MAIVALIAPGGRFARRRGRLLLAALLSAAAALTVAAAPASSAPVPQAPSTFWGVSPQLERPQSDYFLMKRAGVDSIRFPIPWSVVEPEPGVYDFALIDRYVERAATAGIEIFPAINATPNFYGVNCTPADCFTSLPSQTAEQKTAWQNLLRALVGRYGPGGAFWTQNPHVPASPIRIWQLWNEANFFFFTSPRSPQLYAELVRISHQAINPLDPGAKLILAGLFAHPRQSPPQAYQAADFLDQVYEVDGIKEFFDGVALHPYALDASELPEDIEEIRAVMSRHDDERTPLYLTEIGWGDATDTGFERGPVGQSRELAEAFTLILEMQRKARIQRVFWYAWEDITGSCNFCESVGLLDEAGEPKPAFHRFVDFAGCFGELTTVLGTNAGETINGTPGTDVIFAGAGDDRVNGNGGDDRICGEDGNDTIVTRGGRDFIAAGWGNDTVRSGGGADWVPGDLGNDKVVSGAGNDRIYGDVGIDRLLAGAGKDHLFGDGGNDFLFGAGGNDRLFGGGGKDRLFGQKGNDTIFGGAGADFLFGGAGRDVLKPGKGRDRIRN